MKKGILYIMFLTIIFTSILALLAPNSPEKVAQEYGKGVALPIRPPKKTPVVIEPGDQLSWKVYKTQKKKTDADWGPVLTDIEQHLPASYGKKYYNDDWSTHGHETTHGINSELRNNHAKNKGKENGFYLLNDKAAFVVDPKVTMKQVAPLIPTSLQGTRYNLYMIQQANSAWNNVPTYIFDEWVAYTNGAEVGIDRHKNKLKAPQWRSDTMIGQLEFTYYALAFCLAVEKHDPAYLKGKDGKQFKEFVAHEIRRAMKCYREGIKIDHYKWDTNLQKNFKTKADAKDLRDLAERWYGKAFVKHHIYK